MFLQVLETLKNSRRRRRKESVSLSAVVVRLVEQFQVQVDGSHARYVVGDAKFLVLELAPVQLRQSRLGVFSRVELDEAPVLGTPVLQSDLAVGRIDHLAEFTAEFTHVPVVVR